MRHPLAMTAGPKIDHAALAAATEQGRRAASPVAVGRRYASMRRALVVEPGMLVTAPSGSSFWSSG